MLRSALARTLAQQQQHGADRVRLTHTCAWSHYPAMYAQDNVVSGWLRKLDSHKITMRKRWVVIDGSNLMYYEDRAVSARCSSCTRLATCGGCGGDSRVPWRFGIAGNTAQGRVTAGRLSLRAHVGCG